MKKKIVLFLKIAVSVLLLFFLFQRISVEQLASSLKALAPVYVFASAALVFAAVLFGVLKWGYILKSLKMTFMWKDLWAMYWAGTFFNIFSPGGLGLDALRIYNLQKRDAKGKDAAFSVVIERLMAAFSLGVIGMISYSVCDVDLPVLFYVFCAISGLSLVAASGIFVYKRDVKIKYIVPAVFYTAAFHGANIALNLVLFKGMAVNAGFGALCLITAASSVISMIPVSINGLGIREGGYVFIGAYFGIPSETAMAVSLCFFAVVSLTSVYGGYFVINKRYTRGGLIEN